MRFDNQWPSDESLSSRKTSGAPERPTGGPIAGTGPTQTSSIALRIEEALKAHDPAPKSVECYVDVELPWLQVYFDGIILNPDQVLSVGKAIADVVADSRTVFFHALRPRSMIFIVAESRPAHPPAKLSSASSYGVPLADMEDAWQPRTPPTRARKVGKSASA